MFTAMYAVDAGYVTVSRTKANNDQQQPQGRTTAATPTQGQQPPP